MISLFRNCPHRGCIHVISLDIKIICRNCSVVIFCMNGYNVIRSDSVFFIMP